MALPPDVAKVVELQELVHRHNTIADLYRQHEAIAATVQQQAAARDSVLLQHAAKEAIQAAQLGGLQRQIDEYRAQSAVTVELARHVWLQEQLAARGALQNDIRNYIDQARFLPGNGFSGAVERVMRSVDSARPAGNWVDAATQIEALETYRRAQAFADQHIKELRTTATVTPTLRTNIAEIFGIQSYGELYEAYVLSRQFLGLEDEATPPEETDQESLVETIVSALLIAVIAFGHNTLDAGRRFSALDLVQFLAAILSFTADGYTADDRGRDIETHQEVIDLSEAIEKAALAEGQRAEAIARLPRAEVLSDRARLRKEPNAKAEIRATLALGENVAILSRSGNWHQVLYSDPITSEPQEAWIWSKSIQPFDDAPPL